MLPVPSLAQIEKELLAITWACDKFDQYPYGQDKVTVETDHEPLKPVFKTAIYKLPKHLQRMRLALQKYNLQVQHKKGSLIYNADALSHAYLMTTDGAQTISQDELSSHFHNFSQLAVS